MKKIKKLTFAEMNDASTLLTRQEMRQIMAGSGGGCDCAICYYMGCPTREIYVSNCSGDPGMLCPTDLACSLEDATWGICY